ncbi:hypothetical protein SAMN05444369_11051 [Capnocytophaga haemolytica]|jgi:transcriptional regulator|uniref:Transcriptional regulator n=1 Tax=Capnocytophaga haemolytica TaxID=45243 RepID=A0AAX2GXG5_9FLAO|nr:hypothetical protein [Capnocytophaga haemolytica]AMD85414.1 hypothetical protein AXF12_07755 [Capnocytophaga haemolytica]SFO12843.1 hypothetical protein SAMN05444369_11051 [Capnocytophaga haemolytica]SNV01891.1 Uncharacterised protein [Capnocytophaga haemolytica]
MTKDRILQFIDYKEFSIKTFLEKTGIKRGFLDTDKRNATVADVYLAKIIAVFPELNLEWLVTGKGEMLKPAPVTIMQNGNTNAANNVSGKVRKIEQNVEYSNKELIEIIREKDKQIAEKDKQINKLLDKISN